jgi:hypothetical protein
MDDNKPEPRGLLYILLSAFAVFCGWSLAKLRAPSQDASSAQHPQDSTHNATEIGQNIPSPVHVIVDASPPTPTPNEKREAREQRQEGHDKKRLRAEIVLAFVTSLLLIANLFLIFTARRANKIASDALEISHRPWAGMNGDVGFSRLNLKNEVFQFLVSYKLKNFGASPALNIVVQLGNPIEDVRDLYIYDIKVNDACQSAENLTKLTGDLLLPSGDKPDTWTFGEKAWKVSFIIPGCIAYRDTGGAVHHTQLCYVMDDSGALKPSTFRTCWFQYAD